MLQLRLSKLWTKDDNLKHVLQGDVPGRSNSPRASQFTSWIFPGKKSCLSPTTLPNPAD